MKDPDVRQLFAEYVAPTYGRFDIVLTRGEGAHVWDENGKKYLDLGAGIAVSILGHANPRLLAAINRQAGELIHTSNLYFTRPQGELAKRLVEMAGAPGKVFFSNSGAEANEALFKAARRYGHESAGSSPARFEIITFEGSFHGRTMAGISATGQPKVKKGFEPLLPGFRHVPFNDLAAVQRAVGEQTVGVMLEVVQGEGGIHVATPEFLRGLRALCDEKGLLLMFDEIQAGIGRLGTWCGWATLAPDVIPDAVSWAKAIGGGFPLGASWFRRWPVRRGDGTEFQFCDVLQPGTHGTTFGGTPLACAAALAVLDTLETENRLSRAAEFGAFLKDSLRRLPGIAEVRGIGLMLGLEIQPGAVAEKEGKTPAQIVVNALMEGGLLTIPAGVNVVRLLPPLTLERADVEEALQILGETMRRLARP